MRLPLLYRRRWWLLYLPIAAFIVSAIALAATVWKPLPPRMLTFGVGPAESSYLRLAQVYASRLERMGIAVEIVTNPRPQDAEEILEREKPLTLPQLIVSASASLPNGHSISEEQVFPSEAITLEGVELERPMGRIRPDVWAHTREAVHWPAGPLLIEVTVTNRISNERLERIRAQEWPSRTRD